jgi:Zn-dependent protease/CBS domain-containing protein
VPGPTAEKVRRGFAGWVSTRTHGAIFHQGEQSQATRQKIGTDLGGASSSLTRLAASSRIRERMPESRSARVPERGIHLFTVSGIRIIIDYSWFVIFLLVAVSLSTGYLPQEVPGASASAYWTAGMVATLSFFLSILIHELAHSLVAMAAGIQIPSITLFLFGGVSRLSEEAKDPRTELKIAVVGPFSSFALALLFWVARERLGGLVHPLAEAVVEYLSLINLALGIFNLIPGLPLDGGRVLRAIVWWRTGSIDRATRLVSDLGKTFAVTLMFLGAILIFRGALLSGVWLIFIGMFLRGAAASEYEQLSLTRALQSVRVGDVMIQDPLTVPPDLTLSDLVNRYFLRYGYRGFPVEEAGKAVGLISVTDLAGLPESELRARSVRAAMRPLDASHVISREAPLMEALERVSPPGVGRLLVLEGDRITGMITKTGLLRLLEIRQILKR